MTSLFAKTQFYTSVNDLKHLPKVASEVAVVGRSNAGKSSVINTLTNRRGLAYVSKTPGRTQLINYFTLSPGVFLVDLPGYGYAAVPAAIREHWVELLGDYLKGRRELIGLMMIMDCRHPLAPLDRVMLDFVAPRGIPVHILLTKADKLARGPRNQTLSALEKALKPWREQGMTLSAQLFSSLEKTGGEEVEEVLSAWLASVQPSHT